MSGSLRLVPSLSTSHAALVILLKAFHNQFFVARWIRNDLKITDCTVTPDDYNEEKFEVSVESDITINNPKRLSQFIQQEFSGYSVEIIRCNRSPKFQELGMSVPSKPQVWCNFTLQISKIAASPEIESPTSISYMRFVSSQEPHLFCCFLFRL